MKIGVHRPLAGGYSLHRAKPTSARPQFAAASKARRARRDVRAVTDKAVHVPVSEPEAPATLVAANGVDEEAVSQFNWFKQWYVVAVAEYIDTTRPYKLELLGLPMVLWKDGTGTWRCFENMCPHRLAPLSEGRIEPDGNLMCSYHAWRFNGEGKCVALPQAKDEATFQKIVQQPRACVKSYPVRVEQGCIWVWADSSPTAFIDCQVRPPAIIPELDQDLPPGWEQTDCHYMFRDLPYGWDYTHENVMDRAHLAISHHGITGSRYEDAYFMDTDVKVGETLQDGFKSSLKTLKDGVAAVNASFEPPCLWKVIMTFDDGAQDFVILYSSPKKPGITRWVGLQFMIKPKNSTSQVSGFAQNPLKLPIWMKHIFITLFIHQDVAFLHFQERFIAEFKKGMGLHDRYWMPCPQDKDVIVFRKWFERAGGVIPYVGYEPGYVPPLLSEDQMFDFYEAHAKHCHHCMKGLKQMKALRVAVWAAAAFCFVKAMVTAAVRQSTSWLPPKGSIILSAVGLVCVGIAFVLNQMIGLFFVYKYSHADND